MAVLQSKLQEIRYLKRQNLEEESKIVGNAMRDIIRQFGVDCNYYKLKIPYLQQFKRIIDDNTLILHAYGQVSNPDYSLSTEMLTYMEVENDVFQMNKYGVLPDMNVNFYFNTTDFACSMAYGLGQLKEYPIKQQEFIMEVPSVLTSSTEIKKDKYGKRLSYESDILSGYFTFFLDDLDTLSSHTVLCHPYEHDDLAIRFPANDTIYKSFEHVIGNKEFVDQMLFLNYKIDQIQTADGIKNVLHGTLSGSILFHDLTLAGKYMDKIHPDVGDIVTIDFPDENNRQQFEITECVDKNLANDGINPLLHKYVWKCKARRYINSGEVFPEKNEANERWQEGLDFLNNADEEVISQIAEYDEKNNDAVYGGYERENTVYDKEKADPQSHEGREFIDDGSYIEILKFHDGCKLITDGYELYFVNSTGNYVTLTTVDETPITQNLVAKGLQYLKATDNALYFVNFDEKVQRLCDDKETTKGEVEYCLNSLLETTYQVGTQNKDGDFYFKFTNCNTVLFSLHDNLYCRLGNKNHQLVKLC